MRAILVHGAWQGSWAWERLLPRLTDADIDADAIDLPGNGTDLTPPKNVTLDLYVQHIGERIAASDAPVHLVGHSGGGVIVSQAAEIFRERVSSVIYIAGMMLPDGGTFADVVGPLAAKDPTAAGIRPHLVWSDDRLVSTVPADVAREIFFHDCAAEDATRASQRLTPQPEGGRAVSPRVTLERFGTLPRLYIEAINDRSVVLAAQKRMQALVPGADVVSLDSGHVPQLAMPRKLADNLIPWLRRHAAR